jgi:arginyl-tRNA synthetase
MSTLGINELATLLGKFSVSDLIPDVQGTRILTNPLDVWRSLLAVLIARLIDGDVSEVYKCIQWPNNISNGDLSVTLPKLRPGCKANELSSELVDKV